MTQSLFDPVVKPAPVPHPHGCAPTHDDVLFFMALTVTTLLVVLGQAALTYRALWLLAEL